MRNPWVKFNLFCISAIFLFLCISAFPAHAQNLVVGGDMEDESAWNITYFTDPQMPEYEFNYTDDSLKFGRGGCLHIFQAEAFGQLLLWQRLKLIAGQTYRATGAIKAMDYWGGPEGGGAWYQMYIDTTEVDEAAGDYNPGAIKFFNMDGWQADFPEIFDDFWEVVNLGGGVPEAPYYTPEGTPGEEVEVTFGIKFGQWWSDYSGTLFELLVDEIGLFPVESAINAGGNMENEDDWNITYFTDPEMPEYEFNFTDDTLRFGHGGNLHIFQGEAFGQLLLWQRIPLIAGETYRATGAIRALDYWGGPEGGGAWYQLYIDPEEVDETAGDYNPGAMKFFNMDGWQADFPEIFDNLWESENLYAGYPEAPYYTPAGTPGEKVELTFGIKFGHYWSDYSGTMFELLIDDVYLFPLSEAGVVTAVPEEQSLKTSPEFVLHPNYPNPFNPGTTIQFTLPVMENVKLSVYDITGRHVKTLINQICSQGIHSVVWDGRDDLGNLVASGLYLYKLESGAFSKTRKLIFVQ